MVSRTNDLLAANPSGLRLLAGIEDWPAKQRNVVRFLLLHPAARELFADWDAQVRGCVTCLRALAGTDADAPDLANSSGAHAQKPGVFARLWGRYELRG